ncbi:hypothetical protein AB0V97_23605 [Escherichia coli]|nr:hypothetical protein [Escherichia coli]EFG8614579.1 hypothetical protein [Escherichia coli]ELX5256079.1 hypothetical protein [Escherichia coli]MBU3518799.1 hypothetical protein [Escherichia coli]MBU3532646.1 hypothetical protein [Escherichia coli]HBL8100594.1 hypothetical protein [Escherichia coli]
MYGDFDYYLEKEKYFEDELSQHFSYWEEYCGWLAEDPTDEENDSDIPY